jgi:hypothetical protein
MSTPNSSASNEVVTAALLVIGGKILSGRTKDQNIGYIAEYLTVAQAKREVEEMLERVREHNRIAEPRPLTAKTGVRVP